MKPRVMLDAGHGGKDPGAVGPGNLQEKAVALSVVMLIGALLLDAGADVFYTRKTDVFVELAERARLGNAASADLFLSIHCNSADNRKAGGFEVFTTPGKTRSDDAATDCFKSYGEEFPTVARRMDSSDGDPDKEENFAVLRLSHGPAILFELGFISNPTEEDFLGNSANQLRMAKAIAKGVIKFLGLIKEAAPGPVPSSEPAVPAIGEVPKELPVETELRDMAARLTRIANQVSAGKA